MRLYHMSRLVRLDGYDAGMIFHYEGNRPPSSSLSYPGAGANDDARSPGSGGTPGPLSQQAPASLDSSDPVPKEKFGSNGRTAPMVKTRPGSVSHRRVYKFTTSSHKDSLRRQEHDNPQLALSPSDDSLYEDLSKIEAFEDASPLTPVLVAHIVLLPLRSPGHWAVREKKREEGKGRKERIVVPLLLLVLVIARRFMPADS
ncbi:Homeobox protein homothorax [Trachymyrmex zeteki]|uniref:Homeobox protein homothorax n=1 Tax=Mycetomoellerius zeteki TaxID=64791 RepID=A0A151XCR5_9HYME|nr:Homeobox protein homothorax [Trachymyrmex zeteki]